MRKKRSDPTPSEKDRKKEVMRYKLCGRLMLIDQQRATVMCSLRAYQLGESVLWKH